MTQTPGTRLITSAGDIDRRAVQLEARRQYEQSKRLGLDWPLNKCLSFAWAKARGQRELSAFAMVEREARRLIVK